MTLPALRIVDGNSKPPADCFFDPGQFVSKEGLSLVSSQGCSCCKRSP